MKKVKLLNMIAAFGLLVGGLCACANGGSGKAISVITREDGSGTRGAFVELMKVTNADGKDAILSSAEVTNSTAVMISTVAGNEAAIGYISLGSLSDDVKAVQLNGADATVENIKNGTYSLARPFNLVFNEGKLSAEAADFVSFIMSKEGQEIVSKKGYIAIETSTSYTAGNISGKITLAGSTSVSPLMEVLADEYKKLNPNASVEITQSGSSAGITSAIEGVCDIGMSSRDLKESEAAKIGATKMAMDGIAVIVHKNNSITNLTSEQVQKIFLGELTSWDEASK